MIVLANCGETFAQENNAYLTRVPSGQKLKIQGIVIKRKADSFRVRDIKMLETDVSLTDSTKVRTHHNGVFRGGKSYAAGNILRGLRLQVEGVGNADGQLVASLIKFDERDLRTAQALQATVDPVEELAESNQERITSTEKNAEKLAGQIEENNALASAAQSTATRERITADSALNQRPWQMTGSADLGFTTQSRSSLLFRTCPQCVAPAISTFTCEEAGLVCEGEAQSSSGKKKGSPLFGPLPTLRTRLR